MGSVSSWGQDPFYFQPSPEQVERVAGSKTWLRLLHYRAPFLRQARSDVTNSEFFMDPDGRRDPRRELLATVRAVQDTQSRAFCAFPARVEFLKREFGAEFSKALPTLPCPDFQAWRSGIAAKAVSLVYSSAYPNNPASMFGHTFLRLDRKAGGGDSLTKETDLFSYGVNFSASVPDDENNVKYALWGLFGGYLGRYDLAPYYRKVHEYAFAESRDLWEYRLHVSEAETEQLVRHLWELYSGGFFKYYFLDENCSFQILTALEAVKPEWDLSSGFILSAIPIETVKKFTNQEGMVDAVALRPSLRARRERSENELTLRERERLRALFSEEATVNSEDSAPLLDAFITTLNYEKAMNEGAKPRSELLKTALLARSQLGKSGVIESQAIYPNAKRPDLSHGTSRVTLGGGFRTRGSGDENGSALQTLSISVFEHDFLNRPNSFNPFSEVRVLKLEFEKKADISARLREARILEMASFAPYSFYHPLKSWRVAVSWSRAEDLVEHESGGVSKTDGGYGYGQEFLSRNNLAYVLAAGELETGSALTKSFRFSPGGELGFLLNPVEDRYFLRLRALLLHDLTAVSDRRMRWRLEASQAYAFSQNWDVRLGISRISLSEGPRPFETRGLLSLSVMF